MKRWYWRTVPYNWRPGQIWYRFKCWVWNRYSTVKPRYLPHTWCDRCELLPHMMFEILCEFIEEECSPGHVDWEGSGHMVEVHGEQVNVIDEMRYLVDWWHNVHNKVNEVEGLLWAEAKKHSPRDRWEPCGDDLVSWEQDFDSDEHEEIYKRCMHAMNRLEVIVAKSLEEKLQRIIKIMPYMWT